MPPKWAMGLWFICRTQANSREFLDDCYAFRREGIPCDAIGLEPGWMEIFYDYSTTKDWSSERFPVPSYARYGESMFIPAARRIMHAPERPMGLTRAARDAPSMSRGSALAATLPEPCAPPSRRRAFSRPPAPASRPKCFT